MTATLSSCTHLQLIVQTPRDGGELLRRHREDGNECGREDGRVCKCRDTRWRTLGLFKDRELVRKDFLAQGKRKNSEPVGGCRGAY